MGNVNIIAYGVAALLILAMVAAGVSVASAEVSGGAFGGFSLGIGGPGTVFRSFGSDTWGWGGLSSTGGFDCAGSCGGIRHGHGALWSFWNPGPW